MPIHCRNCGEEGHFTIRCPLRSPGNRATREWEETVDEFEKRERAKPFQCSVPLHPGKEVAARGDTLEEFWADIDVSHQRSLYRDFTGIKQITESDQEQDSVILPVDHPNVEPGHYKFIGRTLGLRNPQLYEVLDDARLALRHHRPLEQETVGRVHGELLLLFNHFSLTHEGNDLGLDETEVITNLLSGIDLKRAAEESVKAEIVKTVNGSDRDIQEAINHVRISQQLQAMAENEITETTVLQIHSMVMEGLLNNPDEGLPGEYRHVSIVVHGDDRPRALPCDIAPLMKRWSESLQTQNDDKHIVDFLSRIHSKFQEILPFVDGNGRTGRLIMNLFLLKNGYPVLTFPRTLSFMFNQGVYNGIRGNHTIFSRLLAESLFNSFEAYEKGLGDQLLPTIRDVGGAEIARPVFVTP